MKILLVGDGARENIIAEQLARSCELYAVCEKNNPGIRSLCQKTFVGSYSNLEAIGSFAIREKIDIAFVTSEAAIAKGLQDSLLDIGVALATASSEGALLGENRQFSYNIMKECKIARPEYFICRKESEIKGAMKKVARPVVRPSIRVEWGGTKVAEMDATEKSALILHAKRLARRHKSVIIEERIEGETFSLQGFCDGNSVSLMPPCHVARRALADNTGKITEGMGGYSTGRMLPFMAERELKFASDSLKRIVTCLKKKGISFRGPIRGEFIIGRDGAHMLDCYSSLGDVDTLNNFLILNTQLSEIIASVAAGRLIQFSFLDMATVAKFLVPERYPGKTRKKTRIEIDERRLWDSGAKAYFDDVDEDEGAVLSTSGRAVAVCAKGSGIEEADEKTEEGIASLSTELRWRRDIASKEQVARSMKQIALLRGS